MRRLFESGWWVLVAAILLSAAMAAFLVIQHGVLRSAAESPADGVADDPWNGFDRTSLIVPPEHVLTGTLARDGVPVLDHPETIDAAEVERRNREERGKVLVSTDRVVGVAVNGEYRAYPIRLLWWHEVVNDTVGGEPLAITYSPLSDGVVVFSRRHGERVLDFGVSGLLMASNHLLYDRAETADPPSLWSQLQARAVGGPAAAAGEQLTVVAADLTSWASWRERHPDTTVLAPLPELGRLYKRAPYSSYFGSDLLRFPTPVLPPPSELDLKDRVVVITVGDERAVLALEHLARATGTEAGSWTTTVAGVPVRVDFDVELATSTVTPLAEPPAPLDLRRACWFAWYAADPAPLTAVSP